MIDELIDSWDKVRWSCLPPKNWSSHLRALVLWQWHFCQNRCWTAWCASKRQVCKTVKIEPDAHNSTCHHATSWNRGFSASLLRTSIITSQNRHKKNTVVILGNIYYPWILWATHNGHILWLHDFVCYVESKIRQSCPAILWCRFLEKPLPEKIWASPRRSQIFNGTLGAEFSRQGIGDVSKLAWTWNYKQHKHV